MARPTEDAIAKFRQAAFWADSGKSMLSQIGVGGGAQTDRDMEKGFKHAQLNAMIELANGLSDLATGLRATYILLEEVKKQR
jgi:hypothetical protein